MKMSKCKKLSAVLLAVVVIACVAVLCACTQPHAHQYSQEWSTDEQYHWHVCVDEECDNVADSIKDKAEHSWQVTVDGTTKTSVCSVCQYEKVEEDYLLTVDFVVDEHATVKVFQTQERTDEGVVLTDSQSSANVRSKSGALLSDGEGQINFTVDVAEGYTLASLIVTNTDSSATPYYKNLKSANETGVENAYRITKISGNLTVTITTVANSTVDVPTITFVTDENCQVLVSYEKLAESLVAYARNGDTAELLASGGQVNFLVTLDDGYVIDSLEITNADETAEGNCWNNLKDSTTDPDDFEQNMYRITKISGDIVVTITSKLAPFEVTFLIVDEQGNTISSGASVVAYDTQVLENGAKLTSGGVVYARNSSTGAVDTTGDGQVNFQIVLDGYNFVSISLANTDETETSYWKNLKDVDTNQYRITKISGNITVTVVVSETVVE